VRELKVKPIQSWETTEWLLNKHYANRIPPITMAFGLFINNIIRGICTFGPPCRAFNNGEHIFNDLLVDTFELNRLCVDDDLDKNMLSRFIALVFKELPKPVCLISYADHNMGHHGYIYQATNWIYTGLNKIHDTEYIIDGKPIHSRTLTNKGITAPKEWAKKNNIETKGNSSKHRYLYFIGTKAMKKNMLKKLKLKTHPYPKGDNKRYDSSYAITIKQSQLFY
jgi:hypothetical protein